MKKTYMQPTIKVVVLKRRQYLLAGSVLTTGTTPTSPSSSDAPAMLDFENFGY